MLYVYITTITYILLLLTCLEFGMISHFSIVGSWAVDLFLITHFDVQNHLLKIVIITPNIITIDKHKHIQFL